MVVIKEVDAERVDPREIVEGGALLEETDLDLPKTCGQERRSGVPSVESGE